MASVALLLGVVVGGVVSVGSSSFSESVVESSSRAGTLRTLEGLSLAGAWAAELFLDVAFGMMIALKLNFHVQSYLNK